MPGSRSEEPKQAQLIPRILRCELDLFIPRVAGKQLLPIISFVNREREIPDHRRAESIPKNQEQWLPRVSDQLGSLLMPIMRGMLPITWGILLSIGCGAFPLYTEGRNSECCGV